MNNNHIFSTLKSITQSDLLNACFFARIYTCSILLIWYMRHSKRLFMKYSLFIEYIYLGIYSLIHTYKEMIKHTLSLRISSSQPQFQIPTFTQNSCDLTEDYTTNDIQILPNKYLQSDVSMFKNEKNICAFGSTPSKKKGQVSLQFDWYSFA